MLLCTALLLGACRPSPPSFQNVDITGADYGKDFSLIDSAGKQRSLADFKGKVVVMFFGYTHCPDVCPTTMAELNGVLKQLGDDAQRVQVLFVTLDPARDTPQVLAQYVPAFNPTFLGLTGDAATIDRTAKDFKVFYQKVPGSSPDNYTLDHTAGSYVFDPQGRLRLFVRNGGNTEALKADLKTLLAGG
ncbi:MAG TPA: SCO family protein [Burkholderiales bacterium]|nr:SCO family protein [Burkholderiales bacterium]